MKNAYPARLPSCLGLAVLFVLALGFRPSGSDHHPSRPAPTLNETIVDADGNVYHPVIIGRQVWLKENLQVTRYRDGTPLPQIQAEAEWSRLATGAYCLSENEPEAYKRIYGLLYNYYAVTDERRLCPEGWHVPSKQEWQELEDYLGGPDVAGGRMKDRRSGLWPGPLGTAEESGFGALPAGGRGRMGSPGEIGIYATWWSATEHDSLYAWHWGLYPDNPRTRRNPGHKASGFSVRCIRD